MLPENGRFFLQTMVFGRNVVPMDRVDIRALRDSDAWYLALMGRQFPGSFLPYGQEQIVRSAEPHFRLVSSTSGTACASSGSCWTATGSFSRRRKEPKCGTSG